MTACHGWLVSRCWWRLSISLPTVWFSEDYLSIFMPQTCHGINVH